MNDLETDDGIDPRTIEFIRAFVALWPDSEYGPAHVVLSDYNVDDLFLISSIGRAMRAHAGIDPEAKDYSEHSREELKATLLFLRCLANIPEDKR